MTEYFLLIVSAALVNNFVLVKFLGLCPFLGVSNNLDSAYGMAWATAFVLTVASALSYLVHEYLLLPFELTHLRTLVFIFVIAVAVQLTELMVRSTAPRLHQMLGIYLPLITTNCAVLGVALLNVQQNENLLQAALFGLGAAAGFGLVLVVFAGLRERLTVPNIPTAFQGPAIALITAGLMALAFMGFRGMGKL